MSRRQSDESDTVRAQTLPDFVIGIAVFLLVISFVVAFIPQLTVSYEEQEKSAVAERVASDLSGDLLADPGASPGLNEDCTLQFFANTTEADCPFDTGDALNERLGVSAEYSVNVTLRENVSSGPDSEILCADGGSIGSCGTDQLALGPAVPGDSRSVAASQQVVSVDGRYAALEVRVW